MRAVTFSRALPVILTIAAIFSGGCRSQSPRFYHLNSIQEDQVISKRKSPAQNAVVGIGPVKLADYLDQSLLVTRTSDNQAVKAEFDRWVGSLKDNLINVLADNIDARRALDAAEAERSGRTSGRSVVRRGRRAPHRGLQRRQRRRRAAPATPPAPAPQPARQSAAAQSRSAPARAVSGRRRSG